MKRKTQRKKILLIGCALLCVVGLVIGATIVNYFTSDVKVTSEHLFEWDGVPMEELTFDITGPSPYFPGEVWFEDGATDHTIVYSSDADAPDSMTMEFTLTYNSTAPNEADDTGIACSFWRDDVGTWTEKINSTGTTSFQMTFARGDSFDFRFQISSEDLLKSGDYAWVLTAQPVIV